MEGGSVGPTEGGGLRAGHGMAGRTRTSSTDNRCLPA